MTGFAVSVISSTVLAVVLAATARWALPRDERTLRWAFGTAAAGYAVLALLWLAGASWWSRGLVAALTAVLLLGAAVARSRRTGRT